MIDDPEAADGAVDVESEAYKTLLGRVGRKSQTIPAGTLVRHVLDRVSPGEWPARVEAIDALIRRLESARRETLRVGTRPAEGRALGLYTTRRGSADVRPYRTLLRSVEPIGASCDCPDFLKNSLGLCKHALAVVEHLSARPRLLRQALKEQGEPGRPLRPGLGWDPVRPLLGEGDWLARVTCTSSDGLKGAHWDRVLARFRREKDGRLALARAYADRPGDRLALVDDLLRVVPDAPDSDPALRALLVAERDRLRLQLKRSVPPGELATALKGLKRTLYPYQREGVERFLATGRLLLADDMGLGKTAQSIASCEVLWRSRRVRRGLIIAPASLKSQWAREWASFSDLPIVVVDGTPAERLAFYRTHKTGLLVINYEQLIRDRETIREWGPDLIVLDEAQRIKNWATKTAMAVKGLDPPYRLVLTGTPMENRIEELASVVEWVDPMALEPKWRLNPLHTIRADGKTEVVGVRHLDTIRSRLKGCMLRRIRQDVLDQLPPRTDVRVPVEMTEDQLVEHDSLVPQIVSLMQRSKTRPLTQAEFLRLMSLLTTQRIISNGLAQLRFVDVWPEIRTRTPDEGTLRGLASPKLAELRATIRQVVLEQGRKAVVFSQWRRMLTLAHWSVADLLGERGLRAAFFTGAEKQARRTQNIVEFHDDPDLRILFASDAGGVGLNLQHAANCVINLELPWNPAVLEQRIGRIYRLGQRHPIDVYNLVSEPGIESRIAGLVGSKQAFFKGLFDGETDSVQFDQSGSFLARVGALYEPTPGLPRLPGPDDLPPLPLLDDDSDLDADDPDPLAPILDQADESTDPASPVPTTPADIPSPTPTVADPGPMPPPLPSGTEVRRLFSRLEVRRKPDGGIVIEAPPEAASTLAALFEGLAALLQSVSAPVGEGLPGPSGVGPGVDP